MLLMLKYYRIYYLFISYIQVSMKMKDTMVALKDLDLFCNELFPLARRATMLYSVLRSLASVQKEYQFTLPYYLKLFDEVVGGDFPAAYLDGLSADLVRSLTFCFCFYKMIINTAHMFCFYLSTGVVQNMFIG